MKRRLVTVLTVYCLAVGASGASANDVSVLARHKGWVTQQLHSPPDFGVNRTRLRWADATESSEKSWTLDIAASSRSVTGRWPAGWAFSAGRTASRGESGGNVRSNSIGVGRGRKHARLEDFPTPDEGYGGYLTDPWALGPYLAYGWYETTGTVKGSCDAWGLGCDARTTGVASE